MIRKEEKAANKTKEVKVSVPLQLRPDKVVLQELETKGVPGMSGAFVV